MPLTSWARTSLSSCLCLTLSEGNLTEHSACPCLTERWRRQAFLRIRNVWEKTRSRDVRLPSSPNCLLTLHILISRGVLHSCCCVCFRKGCKEEMGCCSFCDVVLVGGPYGELGVGEGPSARNQVLQTTLENLKSFSYPIKFLPLTQISQIKQK